MPDIQPTFAPDVIAQQQQIDQQRQLAQALLQRGLQDQGGTQMAGGVAIRNSPIAGLANALSAYTGGKMLNQSNKDSSALAGRRQQMLVETLKQGLSNYQQDPNGSIAILAQNPDTAQYAQELLKGQYGKHNNYALTPTYFRDKDGNLKVYQLNSSGGGQEFNPGTGLSPAQDVITANQGGTTAIIGKKTGAVVDQLGKTVDPNNIYNQSQQTERQFNEPAIAGQKAVNTAAVDRAQANIDKANTMKLWEAAKQGLVSGLQGSETGPIAGRLPAVTSAQQVAEGGVSAMAPVLKQLFRVAGEGTFTDKDQELLLKMLPTRTDTPEAAKAKLANIDNIVNAKLAPTGQQPTAPAQSTPVRLKFNPATGQLE